MAKFKITTITGVEEVEGRKFSYYVGAYRYWFFYSRDIFNGIRITDILSGFKVCDVDFSTRAAALNDDKAACKLALDNLVKKHGPAKIKSILDHAPTIDQSKAVK